MLEDLPNDADGDALRNLVAHGSDLSKEMEIDFMIEVPDHESGLAFRRAVSHLGFKVSTECNDKKEVVRWTCYCSKIMIPSYENMIKIQKEFERLGKPYGAKPDGWGTFGNAPHKSKD